MEIHSEVKTIEADNVSATEATEGETSILMNLPDVQPSTTSSGDVELSVEICLRSIINELDSVKSITNEATNISSNDTVETLSSTALSNDQKLLPLTPRMSVDGEIPISLSSSSDSSSETDLFSDSEPNEEESPVKLKTKPLKTVVTKGEKTVYDLPPIENLKISVPVEHLFHIGRISSVVDVLVVVQSFKNMPAINLDSVLFLRDGTALGHVFDVFGKVTEPLYSIRFNSTDEITDRKISVDMAVYIAEQYPPPITDYVFYKQLQQMRGSDASWKHNNEPPEHIKYYSDDEEERRDKMKQRAKRKGSKQL